MTVLYIIAALLLLLLVLMLPYATVRIEFKEKLYLKIKYAGIKLFEMKPENGKEDSSADTVSDKKAEKATESDTEKLFSRLKKKYGFTGALKSIFGFAGDLLTRIKKPLRHTEIKKLRLAFTVAAEDAAATAINYGIVCSSVYPLLTMLDGCVGADLKKVDIKSDFTAERPTVEFSADIRLRAFFLIKAAYGAYSEYGKFVSKENDHERK